MPLSSGSARRSTASWPKCRLTSAATDSSWPAGARRVQQLKRHAHLGANTEEPRKRSGNQLGGHQEHEAVGQRHKAIADDDIGFARGVIRGQQIPAKAQLAAEFGGGRFFRKEGVGPALEHCAVHDFRGQRAAELWPRLIQRVLDGVSRRARLFQLISRCQPRNATANDRNPHSSTSLHDYSKLRHARAWKGTIGPARDALTIGSRRRMAAASDLSHWTD